MVRKALAAVFCWFWFVVTATETEHHDWGRVVHSESCSYEVFVAECQLNEIIVVQTAQYGHIARGKCIQIDIGFFGCFRNVTDVLDSRCSGKRRCQLAVSDQVLRETRPCVSGIELHLKVTYVCVKAPANICSPLQASERQGYISSTQIYSASCAGRPSVDIAVANGQNVNLTLVNISPPPLAVTFGLITGEDDIDELQVASHGGQVESIGVATSRRINVFLDVEYRHSKVLIGFKAVGCPDITAPPDTAFERDGNTATVSCIDSQQSWQLTCRGVYWLGVIGNCTKKVAAAATSLDTENDIDVHQKWAYALSKEVIYLLTGCITVLSAVIVITTGYFCLKRTTVRAPSSFSTMELVPMAVPHSYITSPQHPSSDYTTPQYPPGNSGANLVHVYDHPLPDIPSSDTVPSRGTVKRNNEEDYTASLSSTSTDCTRKYYVLDKDFINTNNLFSKA